ncbi:MAG: hypothetical protein JJE46_10490 [Acidimicrobiia bacterium]|nr:hypothetical protein [Acidimicrobiia bacterium]
MRALVAILAALPLAVPQCHGAPSRTARCTDTNPRIEITGPQDVRDQPVPADTTLRARGATWIGNEDYPVGLLGRDTGACVVGGTIFGTWPDSDRWSKWHYRGALRFSQPGFSVIDVHVVNTGDGVKPKDHAGGAAQDFWISGSWIQHAHDDCLENDYLHTGVIQDNLFDGCYVMFSARPSKTLDGRDNVMVIDRNVGSLEPMRSVYKGSSPGTGGFFKWSSRPPKVVLTNNVFMAVQPPNHGTLDPPPSTLACSGNVIVWLGQGVFPNASAWLSECPDTVITTDASRYSEARSAWLSAHPQVG